MDYFNYDKQTLDKLYGLNQGFILSYDSEGGVVLSIKLNGGLINSLYKGCPFEFAINRKTELITLTIKDNSNHPFNISGKNFSQKNDTYNTFENILIDLIKVDTIKLILLNETHYQIVNAYLNKKNYLEPFEAWMKSEEEEFVINITNRDFTNEDNILYIDEQKNRSFKFDEYLINGKHGYLQEFSITDTLSVCYESNKEFFISPRQINGTEITDFLIIYMDAAVIIESKYVVSPKATNFTSSINKAIEQLNSAERLLLKQQELIDDSIIKKNISNVKGIIKICVFHDDGRPLEKAFNNAKEIMNLLIYQYLFRQAHSGNLWDIYKF